MTLVTSRARASIVSMTLVGLVIAGAALRVSYFAAGTSLWGDEAALLLELQRTSVHDLTRPFESGQQAPYLFLLAEKALLARFGLNEHWLRFPSLMASLAALVLFAWLAARVLSSDGAVIGTAFFAFSVMLVRYAAELKPYAGDAAATLVMLSLTVMVLRTNWAWRWIIMMAVAGAALVWLSYPLVFVLAGVGTTLFVDRALARRFADALAVSLVGLVWLASFAGVYWIMARHGVANQALGFFWDFYFAPLPPRSLWDVRHSAEILLSMFVDPMGMAGAGVGALLFACGIAAQAVRDWRWLASSASPIAIAFLASAAHLYPFASRLLLFAVPLATLVVAEGGATVATALGRRWAFPVVMACLLSAPLVGVNDLLSEPERSGVRDVLRILSHRAAAEDAIYVYYKAQPSFELYRGGLGRADLAVVRGARDLREGQRVADDLRRLAGRGRVWFLFSEVHTFFVDEEKLMLNAVERAGLRRDAISLGPTHAYLYESSTGVWLTQ
jgi:hypothetical protein